MSLGIINMQSRRGCWGRQYPSCAAGELGVCRNGLDLGKDPWQGWDGEGKAALSTSGLPSILALHLLGPVALAVTPMTPHHRQAVPKLDGLDCIWIN